MKKLFLSLTVAGLIFGVNTADAGYDDYFVTNCTKSGGTVLQNLNVVSIYTSQNGYGFDYAKDTSSNKNHAVLRHRSNANDNDSDDDMFEMLNDAYEHQLAVDACVDSQNNFFALEESEAQ